MQDMPFGANHTALQTAQRRTSAAVMAPRARVDSSWKAFSRLLFSRSTATSSASRTNDVEAPACAHQVVMPHQHVDGGNRAQDRDVGAECVLDVRDS